MRRSTALWIIAAFTAVMALAALAGRRTAPSEVLADRRRSIALWGPEGTSGLAEILRALGVKADPWRRSLFFTDQLATPDSAPMALALLEPMWPLTDVELRQVVRYVERGGRLILAGPSGVEKCFHARIERPRRGKQSDDRRGSTRVAAPPGIRELPEAHLVLAFDTGDSGKTKERAGSEPAPCDAAPPIVVDTLLQTVDGEPVAWTLTYRSGGTVTMVAGADWIANRVLKDTDAAAVVVPWFLASGTRRVVFDEYHQGFGAGGSIFASAWRWTWATPAGWMIWQLVAVTLLFIALRSVRFGPALRGIERRRRSALEHVEALAAGLERARGRDVVGALLARGLRRRLGRGAPMPRRAGPDDAWLWSLGAAARTPDARAAVQRFRRLIKNPRADDEILAAARTVEDVWAALKTF
jgi:hypothetical protein